MKSIVSLVLALLFSVSTLASVRIVKNESEMHEGRTFDVAHFKMTPFDSETTKITIGDGSIYLPLIVITYRNAALTTPRKGEKAFLQIMNYDFEEYRSFYISIAGLKLVQKALGNFNGGCEIKMNYGSSLGHEELLILKSCQK